MARFAYPSSTASALAANTDPPIAIGERAKDETGAVWEGKLVESVLRWVKKVAEIDNTPHQLGAIGASITLPLSEHKSIEGSVGSTPTVAVSLPEADVGTRSTVLLTATANCTVQMPTLHWQSPYGSIWSGVLASGKSVRLNFVRSSLGWEAVEGLPSATAIPVVISADEIAFNAASAERIAGANAQAALMSADSLIDSVYDDIYGSVYSQGNISGTATIDFSARRAVSATATANVAITLTAPSTPKVCFLDINPGGYAVTFATAIKWARATLPDVPSTAGTSITYALRWTGSEWRGDAEYYAVPA
jgi:hypothetical protein